MEKIYYATANGELTILACSSFFAKVKFSSQIQFGLMALHWFALITAPDCGYPKWIAFFMLPQNFFIFILFYDFYRKTYNKKPEVTESVINVDLNNNVDGDENSKFSDYLKKKKKQISDNSKTIKN